MTPEEYERWHVRNCARYGRRAAKSAEWSDGGALPRVDRQLLLYQRWLTERLASIEEPEHRQLLRPFAAWHQM
ncbi:hypothetical protein [Streptomyces sp. NPDC017529]|uniref:hypothetical protein n=1 Tax=Streptomyces sp. NPDC017529 TaxID=3365000 RepID=UPI00379EFF7C